MEKRRGGGRGGIKGKEGGGGGEGGEGKGKKVKERLFFGKEEGKEQGGD